MRRSLQKILVPFAFMLALMHNIFPHHHHEEIAVIGNHHYNDDEDENPFSFKFLDHLFYPNESKVFIADDSPAVSDLLHESNYHPEFIVLRSKNTIVFKNEFPPPSDHSHIISRRGPPLS